jgi:pimeloyl-ACP methyl ester carboxylesterase
MMNCRWLKPCLGWGSRASVLGLVALSLSCVNPMGADRAGVRRVYVDLSRNAISGSVCSEDTRVVLHRYDLDATFDSDPGRALASLHTIACSDGRRDLLFALAEASYQHADRLDASFWISKRLLARKHYLSASIYAYLFLLGPGPDPKPTSFDRRFRLACDLYNHSLSQGLSSADSGDVSLDVDPGLWLLPGGAVKAGVAVQTPSLDLDRITTFVAADRLKVRGLTVRNRYSGMGAPLIAVTKPGANGRAARRPVTVFLRVDGDVSSWSQGKLLANMEVYSAIDPQTVTVGGSTIPLETDITACLAHALNDQFLWNLGMDQFFSGVEEMKSGIYPIGPYMPGRVPVIFVHGTMSSPIWWMEMWNTLFDDRVLHQRCQFWNFVYNSGNPLSVSAGRLRAAITETVRKLDPEGRDPALRQIVVIGHSQGGLLTRLTATDVGDSLWRVVSDKSLDDLALDGEARELMRRTLYYPPLPCVKRVIFISTPHRGSYLSGSLARRLSRKLITFTADATSLWEGLRQNARLRRLLRQQIGDHVPTSIDGMSPDSKFLHALSGRPFAPGVKAHSIVAIRGDDQPPDGDDGVVEYRSAHLDNVESERIVRSGHSCQDKPPTIEEVRRILLEHIAEYSMQTQPASRTAPVLMER